ncbi:MAG TPA: hypothetical protein GX739_01605 [Firmicutes bacterium]|nr:hypothetical protein [Bacillota bacterium]
MDGKYTTPEEFARLQQQRDQQRVDKLLTEIQQRKRHEAHQLNQWFQAGGQ